MREDKFFRQAPKKEDPIITVEEPEKIEEPEVITPVIEEPKPAKKALVKEEAKEEKKNELPIRKGCKVIFNGTKTYSGNLDVSFYKGGTYVVKEMSGNRVVLAKNGEVIAAVNIKDCKRV